MTTPWRTALDATIAAHDGDPTSRYVQVASSRLTEAPANRTLVFRGFHGLDGLLFTADRRSEKVRELRADVRAEACWYFPRTREQFRLRGEVRIVGNHRSPPASLRDDVWRSLSDAVRVQFTWPSPGRPWRHDPEAFRAKPPDPGTPLPNFAVLMLGVRSVDHLDLRGDPPVRMIHELRRVAWYSKERGWRSRRVNP